MNNWILINNLVILQASLEHIANDACSGQRVRMNDIKLETDKAFDIVMDLLLKVQSEE